MATKVSELVHFYFEPVKMRDGELRFPEFDSVDPFFGTDIIGEDALFHTEQVSLSEQKGLVRTQRPPFLLNGNSQQGWMQDFKIQHRPEQYDYTNSRPDWRLPKSLGIANQFFKFRKYCRVVNDGFLSAAVMGHEKTIELAIPSDYALVWTYLNKQAYSNIMPRQFYISKFDRFGISDKGRYLQGIISLFKNIFYAGNTFENLFWRDLFLLMAGRPSAKEDFSRRKDISLKVLREVFTETPILSEQNNQNFEKVAEILANKLCFRDLKAKTLTRRQMEKHFEIMRNNAAKDPTQMSWGPKEKFKDSKEYDLKQFLVSKIFLQGVTLRCPTCFTRQFYVVDDLASEIRCNGCLYKFHLMPSPEWSFKLNDLVINALRKHGTLPVLEALYLFHRDSYNEMFLYLPCMDIYQEGSAEPFTDIDIFFISNGKSHICEVKSNPSGFTEKEFAKLKKIAEELEPDEVILAATGEKWPEKFELEVLKLSESLKPFHIKVSAKLLGWF